MQTKKRVQTQECPTVTSKGKKESTHTRINLGVYAAKSPLKLLDLTEVQKKSYRLFLEEGLSNILSEVNPIYDYTGKNFELAIFDLKIGQPKHKPLQALNKGLSYEAPLSAQAKLTDLENGQSQTQEVYLGELPLMTERGTFIVNGNERVVVNQLTRSPGVYFEEVFGPSVKRKLYLAEIRPERGSWLGMEVDRNDTVWVRINRTGRRIAATTFLKAFGLRLREIETIFKSTDPNRDFFQATLEKDSTQNQDEAFLDIYLRMRPGDPRILENAKTYFEGLFLDPRRFSLGKVGRYKVNKRLKLNFEETPRCYLLQKEDLTSILRELLHLASSQEKGDDIDNLAHRRIRTVGELVGQSFRVGLLRLEKNIRERLSVTTPDRKLTPTALVNARPVVATLNEFFGSSQLSQFMDQTNPLSELSHLRTVSALGPGGLTRERAGTAVRDVQPSHYGRLDTIQTPEGQNIGLRLYLSIFASLDEYGFLRAPYLKVKHREDGHFVTNEIYYLAADEEENFHIAEATVERDEKGKTLPDRVLTRFQGDFSLTETRLVDFVDAHPSQMLGISSGLIPFISSDAGNRALMGANMQIQAVPLVRPETSVVGTGLEEAVVRNSGQITLAKNAGEVIYVDADRIEVRRIDRGLDVYYLKKFVRTNENTCYNEVSIVQKGDRVGKNQALADGAASADGELALGRDLLTAFMPWEGYNYEDSVVVSERLVREDLLTSIHIKEYEAHVMDTKLGPEEITRDIPNVSEESLRNLDEGGIVVVGAKVDPGDILVGKIAPKGETELTAEERLLRAIFGEKAREIRDTSLRMAHGDRGTVISIQILEKVKGDELNPGVLKSIKVRVAQKRKIQVGDKIAGRHGSKGVIAKIVVDEDMPYLEDGTPIDIILNPISILARLNIGQLIETHLAWAGKVLGERYAIPAFDKLPPEIILNKLDQAHLSPTGKVRLYDGRTGEPFENEVVVGYAHIMKLHHLVEDKVHARSTGPYSLITQQPLGGKAQMGGQRVGEMEVWALEAYGAAHLLQEMLTIKSDDVLGRQKAFEAIIKGIAIPEARTPEAFKLLTRELNSLSLSVDTLKFDKEGKKVIGEEVGKNIEGQTKTMFQQTDFDALKLSLASPEDIKQWSYGEVLKPETINYRTLKPEKDGLFDERIFGPTKDYECYCGKYKRVRYKGIICDKCGVEVTVSRVRRERMGHISLAAPVVHTWMFRRNPSTLSLLLSLSVKELENVIYFAQHLVVAVDEDERKKSVELLGGQLQEKKAELEKETTQKITELQKEAQEQIKKTEKAKQGKPSEADELKIENIRVSHRKEVLYLREELIRAIDKLEQVFNEVEKLVGETKIKSLLSEQQMADLRFWGVAGFVKIKMGAEAILDVIKGLDLEEEIKKAQKGLESKSVATRKKSVKRFRVLKGLKEAKIDPSWCILTILPVIPPELRPMVQLPGGRFATSDLNDLYRRVLNRNNRLKNLLNLGAPQIILQNEMRMLQEAVDALIEGPRRPPRPGRKELKSLAEVLKGKQGRFRQNLLGKRVDYSGRSVIVVGPELKVNEVGLPKEMALELFKPFVLRELILRGFAPNLKSAKNVLEARGDEIWDILEDVTQGRPVLLNRAPTLHRQNIQAFYPILIEGNAIKLHPAVCSGYNADFDGDQMAVHVVLSEKAIEEAKSRMLSPLNILKLADGEPIIDLQKEFSVGMYFLTFLRRTFGDETIRHFLSAEDAISAYQQKAVHLQIPIQVYLNGGWQETTAGRLLFNEVLPPELRFCNQAVNRSKMRNLISQCFKLYGHQQTVELVDDFKEVGRFFATLPGISISVFDFKSPEKKEQYIKEAEEKLEVIESNFKKGLMTERERKAQLIALWEETTTRIAEEAVSRIDPNGLLAIIIGAGGSRADKNMIRAVEGMRGAMVDSQGNIKETPIRSALIEQATAYEGFLSSIGGRKGLIDTALLTADAGYLTRRLVDVAHDIIVREKDCQSHEAWWVRDEGLEDWPLKQRIMGRVAALDIIKNQGKKGEEIIVRRNELISEGKAEEIIQAEIWEVPIRSPLTCQGEFGICSLCYGTDLGSGRLIEVGEAVGVIAAQSIGEPGTQLTLRTFHAGGIAKKEITQGLPRVEELFEARTPKIPAILSDLSGKATIKEEDERKVIIIEAEEEVAGKKVKDQRIYTVPLTVEVKIKNGELVSAGDTLTEGHLDLEEILRLQGITTVQNYLLKEIQSVYKSQGVTINDKHVEVILRKMTDRVRVVQVGDAKFLPGDYVTRVAFERENQSLKKAGKTLAKGKRVVLGLIRSALLTESWLSAASFIETSNVLTAAAVNARPQTDYLLGLKENVIIGRLIPTGERTRLKEAEKD